MCQSQSQSAELLVPTQNCVREAVLVLVLVQVLAELGSPLQVLQDGVGALR